MIKKIAIIIISLGVLVFLGSGLTKDARSSYFEHGQTATATKNSTITPKQAPPSTPDVSRAKIDYHAPQSIGQIPPTVTITTDTGKREVPNIQYHALYAPNDLPANQWYTNKINAPAVWDKTTGSSATTVAVIDTGFALNHDELSYRWAINTGEVGPTTVEGPVPNCSSRGLALDKSCNNLDNDGDGYPSNWRGWDFSGNDNSPMAGTLNPTGSGVTHGTNTAGLVGAAGNNNIGATSLNWQTKIMPIQALDDTGTGYTSTIAQAIHYAVDHGADVISMSLGADQPDEAMQVELDYATAHNVTVVAAAGNDGCDCLSYPANYPNVIAVGASDGNDSVASFSSWGSNLAVVAPGAGNLLTTSWAPTNTQNAYTSGSIYGTSFSTPIVAGLVAMLKGVRPDATPAMLTDWVRDGADPLSSSHAGSGRINAYNSLMLAQPSIADSKPVRTTPVYGLSKNGINTLTTTSYDRKQDLVFNQGYVYNIVRFAQY